MKELTVGKTKAQRGMTRLTVLGSSRLVLPPYDSWDSIDTLQLRHPEPGMPKRM